MTFTWVCFCPGQYNYYSVFFLPLPVVYRAVGYTPVVDELSATFPVPFLVYGREKR
jgi:hypothetical protein